MKKVVFLALIALVYGYTFDDEDHKIVITDSKENITRERLTTGKDIGVLDISFAEIENIALDSFCALPNLTALQIKGNSKFPRVTKQLFQCNPELKYVTLVAYKDTQQEMDRDAFTDLKKVTYMRIEGVYLKNIGKDIFKGLDLKILLLANCSISAIDADAFSSLPNLKELLLGRNLIKNFKLGTFQNLPMLTSLQLDKNEIDAINWEEWNTLPSLKTINFADNPLTTCDVSKLKQYFPNITSCNLGNSFNATRKAEIIEECKKLNISVRFRDYYEKH